jgi:hypothetical protein
MATFGLDTAECRIEDVSTEKQNWILFNCEMPKSVNVCLKTSMKARPVMLLQSHCPCSWPTGNCPQLQGRAVMDSTQPGIHEAKKPLIIVKTDLIYLITNTARAITSNALQAYSYSKEREQGHIGNLK